MKKHGLRDLFNLLGWPPEHKHEGIPPRDVKIIEKFADIQNGFEEALKCLGSLRVKPISKSLRYDVYLYYEGPYECLVLTKEKTGKGRERRRQ